MRLLVVNPNTTAAMTEGIAAVARAAAAPGTEVTAVTSAMGPPSIEGYYDEALSLPGLLQALRQHPADAAVIACFDDTGLDAARTLVPWPVVGICQAALAMAAQVATRVSVVTTLARSLAPLRQLVRRYGMAEIATVHASDIPVLEIERSPARLREAVRAAITVDGSDAVVLGCAGMAGLARELSSELGLPVIEGVSAAVKLAEALVVLGLATSKAGAYAAPRAKTYAGALAGFAPSARSWRE